VKWLVPSFLVMPFLMFWYYMMVPASQQALLTLGVDTINAGTFSMLTRMALVMMVTSATIIGVAYFLAYRNPVDFKLSQAIAVLLLALVATGAGEYSREMLRKPYVVGRWMYSNSVRIPSAAKIDQQGYLTHSAWVWNGSSTSYSRGETIFRGECGSCHTLSGYRPLKTLLAGRDRAGIENFVTMLHEYKPDMTYRRFMPPMVGTQQDVKDLSDYLNYQVNPPAAKK
jgi:mono/diheme cytochrome c family protein